LGFFSENNQNWAFSECPKLGKTLRYFLLEYLMLKVDRPVGEHLKGWS
jgi:hypothetical protein